MPSAFPKFSLNLNNYSTSLRKTFTGHADLYLLAKVEMKEPRKDESKVGCKREPILKNPEDARTVV